MYSGFFVAKNSPRLYDVTCIEVDAADTTPLVGMRLMDSHSLYVEVENGGRVIIDAKREVIR